MTEYIKKEEMLFLRDAENKLISQTIELTTIEGNKKVKVIPMLKGDLQKLWTESQDKETSKEQDVEIIKKYLIEPKLEDKEIPFLKPQYMSAVVTAILALTTGVSQEKIAEESKKKLMDKDFLP